MNRVLVVSSVHSEYGRASVSSLVSILEQVRPSVIFLELTPEAFARCLQGHPACLEANAALRYRARHPATLIPVDVISPSIEFAHRVDYMLARVEAANPEYDRLHREQMQYVATTGFAYLNSEDGNIRSAAIDEVLQRTVEALGDERLSAIYASWREAHELREDGMIRGIEAHAKGGPFETGVFLVGLAHRQSLAKRTREASSCVNWDFSGLPSADA